MTNPLYIKMSAAALALLKKFGAPLMLSGPPVRQVAGLRISQMERTLGDSGVMVGDWKYILAATTTPEGGDPVVTDSRPEVTERLVDGDEQFVIVYVEPIKPAETVLAWFVYGRLG